MVNPPKPYLLNPMACPPLGLMTVASALKDVGYDVELIDLNKDSNIPESEIYGISMTTADFNTCIGIRDGIKQQYGAKVIVGGPHPTLCPEECAQYFDVVCVGDYSSILHLNGEKIVYGYTKDFDRYHPDREIVDLWDYDFYVLGERATTVVFTQSCPWRKCAFCCRYQMPYDRVRFHSVKWCEEEIAEIAEKGFRSIQIYDDEFLTFRKRDEQIIKLLSEYGIEVWRCFLRADYCLKNRDLVELAARNGLGEVLVGVESGSDTILKVIDKGTTTAMVEEAFRFLHSKNVAIKAACIVGLPSESPQTLEESWKFYERIEPYVKDWDFTVFCPYPGSKVWNHPEAYDIRFDKEECYTAYKGMHAEGWRPPKISTSTLSFEQILDARDRFERRFKFKEVEDEII